VYAPVQPPEEQVEAHEPEPRPEPEPPAPTPEPEPTSPEPPSTDQVQVLEGDAPQRERRSVQVGEDEDDMGPTTDEIPAVTQTLPPVKD
jgi:hypothetical protein